MPTQPPQGRERQRQRRSEATIERILAAAETLFLKHGFRAASLQEIASAAGHTTGAVYSSFGGKDDLFLALYRARRRSTKISGSQGCDP
jgi:AcrR family transcriptional regulator